MGDSAPADAVHTAELSPAAGGGGVCEGSPTMWIYWLEGEDMERGVK